MQKLWCKIMQLHFLCLEQQNQTDQKQERHIHKLRLHLLYTVTVCKKNQPSPFLILCNCPELFSLPPTLLLFFYSLHHTCLLHFTSPLFWVFSISLLPRMWMKHQRGEIEKIKVKTDLIVDLKKKKTNQKPFQQTPVISYWTIKEENFLTALIFNCKYFVINSTMRVSLYALIELSQTFKRVQNNCWAKERCNIWNTYRKVINFDEFKSHYTKMTGWE